MHITLTRRGITVDVTLQQPCYGVDRFGFSYTLSPGLLAGARQWAIMDGIEPDRHG